MPIYLTTIEIAAIQQDQINRYGGAHGIRDKGALESACHRPQSGYYNNIVEQAAALMESLVMNRTFIDGNKRIAFAAVYTFLKINGYTFNANSMDTYNFMINLLNHNIFTIEHLKPFLEDNTARLAH